MGDLTTPMISHPTGSITSPTPDSRLIGDVWFGIEGVIRDEIRCLSGEEKKHEQVLEWGRGPV